MDGRYSIERGTWFVEFFEQWSQFFGRCNWYTFHPVHFEVENDKILGGIEATIIVLGFGLRWRWNHTETEELTKIKRDVAEIKEKYGA